LAERFERRTGIDNLGSKVCEVVGRAAKIGIAGPWPNFRPQTSDTEALRHSLGWEFM
jgi:hypothetical protein